MSPDVVGTLQRLQVYKIHFCRRVGAKNQRHNMCAGVCVAENVGFCYVRPDRRMLLFHTDAEMEESKDTAEDSVRFLYSTLLCGGSIVG